MRKLTLAIASMLTLACVNVQAQSEAEMKAWMDYMTPGEMHKMLAKSVGSWDGKVTMWMAPDAPPSTSNSTSTVKMEMDGRYQVTHHEGNFMGMPFKGFGLVGYDNAKKVFFGTWVDNMGTGIMNTEGKWDAATKTFHFKGKSTDPMTGNDYEIREVIRYSDDNNFVMEMYGPDPKSGKEFKMMEIVYTRKKS